MCFQEIYEGLKNVGIEPTVLPNDPKRAHRGLSKLVDTSDEDFNKIKFAIFGAFYPNYFLRNFRDLDSHQIKKVSLFWLECLFFSIERLID